MVTKKDLVKYCDPDSSWGAGMKILYSKWIQACVHIVLYLDPTTTCIAKGVSQSEESIRGGGTVQEL